MVMQAVGKDGESLLLLVARSLGLQSRCGTMMMMMIIIIIINIIIIIIINVIMIKMDICVRKEKEREKAATFLVPVTVGLASGTRPY